MRCLLVAGAVVVLAGAFGVGAATAASTKTVKLGDNFFKPKKLTVTAGDTVTWEWDGSNTHNVTVVKGPVKFHSTDQDHGTFTRTMTKAGTYKLTCTFHPGMDMTLKVKKAPAASTTTSS
jgi:plastocyanin